MNGWGPLSGRSWGVVPVGTTVVLDGNNGRVTAVN